MPSCRRTLRLGVRPCQPEAQRWRKLAVALSGVAASLLLPGPYLTYLYFALVLLPLAAWGQIARPFLRA